MHPDADNILLTLFTAACRSRQKKKEWINGLESHAANLQAQNNAVRVRNLMRICGMSKLNIPFS
jgi:hypothetical protein